MNAQPGKRTAAWYAREARRPAPSVRGYDHRWHEASLLYRKSNPLCVPCLMRQAPIVRGVQAVDHIVPIHSCPSLKYCPENWCSMCRSCHGYKTRMEPQESWEPRSDRVVVCGLPGTGKTTLAKQLGLPTYDADERPGLMCPADIEADREEWIREQRDDPCVVIVASIFTACSLAARLKGVVHHCSERFIERNRSVFEADSPTLKSALI